MLSDLRYALRQCLKSPGYTLVVVLTLAIGIAVNAVIFRSVDEMLLQPLKLPGADRLIVITERSDLFSMPHGLSYPDFQDIRSGAKTLQDLNVDFVTPAHVSAPGRKAQRGWIEVVSPDAFGQMNVPMALGRPLQARDGELPPGTPVTVVTHSYWKTHLGADPDIVGRTLVVNSHPLTIVGVTSPDFESFSAVLSVQAFVPTGAYAALRTDGEGLFKYRAAKAWKVYGHLAPGSSLADVNAELAVFAHRFTKDFPQDHRNSRFHATTESHARPDPAVSDLMPALIALFSGLCLLVLLIACANVANLMTVHALAREKEFVVRSALGASRGRLIRQLLIESVLIAALAGLTGFILAEWGSDLLHRGIPKGDMPFREGGSSNVPLYLFTAGISLAAGIVSGLVPALRSSRFNIVESLKQGAGRQIGGGRHRLRNLLVIGQVAVSCVVLICSVLFLRALHAANSLNLGFRPDHLVMLSMDLGMQNYDETRGIHFMDQAIERVRALPGVENAAFTQHVPFNYVISIRETYPENPTGKLTDGHSATAYAAVTPGFLSTMRTPILQGRDLAESDNATAKNVAVINDTMAKAFWPGRDPIGQHFRLDWNGAPEIEVVGVTGTGKYVMLTEEPRAYFYLPQSQRFSGTVSLIVRSKQDPAGLASSLRQVIRDLDPELPIGSLVTAEDHLNTSIFALMPLRSGAKIAAAQGVLALALAIMGLYAVVSYSVTSRTREIGVRMALGATESNVLKLVSREGLRLTVIGVGLGLLLAAATAAGLSRMIFGVHALDVVAYSTVVFLLVGIAGVACWLPARRATKVDPMVALRSE
jgi:predicted permease